MFVGGSFFFSYERRWVIVVQVVLQPTTTTHFEILRGRERRPDDKHGRISNSFLIVSYRYGFVQPTRMMVQERTTKIYIINYLQPQWSCTDFEITFQQ